MNKHFFYTLAFLIIGCTQFVVAQDTLRLQDAITIALKNNYDIRLVKNDVQIARNNTNIGNAGMLPSLGGTFDEGGSRQNTVQTPATGDERRANGVRSTNQSYGVVLDWTIFDGLQMFANYERLKELQKQGEVNAKLTILSTISDVVNAYYAIVRQQQLVKATDSALKISLLRVTIADNKLKIGRGSKLDVLTAKVDYNTDTTLYLQQKNLLATSRITLNQLVARDLNIVFFAEEKLEMEKNLQLAELETLTQQLNPALQNAFINKRIAELNFKQVKGTSVPGVRVRQVLTRNSGLTDLHMGLQQASMCLTVSCSARMNVMQRYKLIHQNCLWRKLNRM
jgi:outer membrane protein